MILYATHRSLFLSFLYECPFLAMPDTSNSSGGKLGLASPQWSWILMATGKRSQRWSLYSAIRIIYTYLYHILYLEDQFETNDLKLGKWPEAPLSHLEGLFARRTSAATLSCRSFRSFCRAKAYVTWPNPGSLLVHQGFITGCRTKVIKRYQTRMWYINISQLTST